MKDRTARSRTAEFHQERDTGKECLGILNSPCTGRPNPANPSRIRPDFDSGDHVHPNDLGYRAPADAIDLALFRQQDHD